MTAPTPAPRAEQSANWSAPGGVVVTVKNKRAAFVPITDATGHTMALVPMGSGRSESRAEAICTAVNTRPALVAALRDLLDGTEPWDVRATRARAALGQEEYPTAQDRP